MKLNSAFDIFSFFGVYGAFLEHCLDIKCIVNEDPNLADHSAALCTHTWPKKSEKNGAEVTSASFHNTNTSLLHSAFWSETNQMVIQNKKNGLHDISDIQKLECK